MASYVGILRGHHLSLEYTDGPEIDAKLPAFPSSGEICGRFIAKMFPVFIPHHTHLFAVGLCSSSREEMGSVPFPSESALAL